MRSDDIAGLRPASGQNPQDSGNITRELRSLERQRVAAAESAGASEVPSTPFAPYSLLTKQYPAQRPNRTAFAPARRIAGMAEAPREFTEKEYFLLVLVGVAVLMAATGLILVLTAV